MSTVARIPGLSPDGAGGVCVIRGRIEQSPSPARSQMGSAEVARTRATAVALGALLSTVRTTVVVTTWPTCATATEYIVRGRAHDCSSSRAAWSPTPATSKVRLRCTLPSVHPVNQESTVL